MNISVQDLGVLGRVSFLQSQPVLRYAIGVISKYVFKDRAIEIEIMKRS